MVLHRSNLVQAVWFQSAGLQLLTPPSHTVVCLGTANKLSKEQQKLIAFRSCDPVTQNYCWIVLLDWTDDTHIFYLILGHFLFCVQNECVFFFSNNFQVLQPKCHVWRAGEVKHQFLICFLNSTCFNFNLFIWQWFTDFHTFGTVIFFLLYY